jgi:DNA-binding HxlR family transcriptional regulator
MRKLNGSQAINERTLQNACVLNPMLALVGRRWKMQILFLVHRGIGSFAALKGKLPGVSDQVLGVRLTELLSEGLLTKCESADQRPMYKSTSRAESLLELMQALCDWGKRNLDPAMFLLTSGSEYDQDHDRRA